MFRKLFRHDAEERSDENLREALDEARKRPLSKLSKEKFSIEKVARIEGVLRDFNSEMFPNLPIDLEKLHVFIDWSGKHASLDMLRLPSHRRSVSFNVIFSDSSGRLYKYLHLKGVGLQKGDTGEVIGPPSSDNVMGLCKYDAARKDWEASMLFLRKGIKTSAPLAIIEIREIITENGERVKVEELKRKGFLQKDFTPVIYIRTFSEIARLDDIIREDFEKFANEHGMDAKECAKQLIERFAENLAKVHKLGKVHMNLIAHNLTLDGRIVDHDTVRDYRKIFGSKDPYHIHISCAVDIRDVALITSSISDIFSKKMGLVTKEEANAIFLNTYVACRPDAEKEVLERMLGISKT